MSNYETALKLAKQAHKGQKDMGGADYIDHPIRVSKRGKTEEQKIVGLLHDVIEDSDLTFKDLRKYGFSEDIIRAVGLLTKLTNNESYDDFIDRIIRSGNQTAIRVKINDLLDNMDTKRLKNVTSKDIERVRKYLNAYAKLKVVRK